jgi:7-dehydrocholesterol reductase
MSRPPKNQNQNDWSSGVGVLPGRAALGPMVLMLLTPIFSIVYFHVCAKGKGDFVQFAATMYKHGVFTTLKGIWPNMVDGEAWSMILGFAALQLALMKLVPGRKFKANITPHGHTPVYVANGTACYLITLGLLVGSAQLGYFDPALIYDKFGFILSGMNIFAGVFCVLLVIKGHVAPSGPDSGSNGSMITDFYWGMELYPRVLGWDVKVFTNCRMGMMFWAVAIVSFMYKNLQINHGHLSPGLACSVAIQLVYISKFFYWEMGYMCSMDIQHDRAGYYICWGCLVWVPAVYTSCAFYLTQHAPPLSASTAAIIFICGATCVFINYDSDQQRYVFRQTKGKCLIWGQPPNKIMARYKTVDGQTKESLLLLDGWWKYSRHFHYVPEIMASVFWSISALDTGFIGPYFYVIYLTILLTDRAFRDDDRCKKKYGKYWTQYCNEVPYMIVPGII